MKTYQLDPDYRKTPDTTKPFCIRCQKPVDPNKAVKVEMADEWTVKEGGALLIGRDCWKKITK
jgi:hypothetical protein